MGRYGYGRRAQRSARSVTPGRVARSNRRPGACRTCGLEILAGAGQLYMEESGSWSVIHVPAEWSGSPVSGYYIGGCPASTDKQNAGAPWNTDGHVRPEAERLAGVAATYAATAQPEPPRGGRHGYTSTGARVAERCTHEDAPCCGCYA